LTGGQAADCTAGAMLLERVVAPEQPDMVTGGSEP
jgi:hypothetical protein